MSAQTGMGGCYTSVPLETSLSERVGLALARLAPAR
jgi:hypothetical protein